MTTDDLAPPQSTRTFSNNARFHAPEHLTRPLEAMATTDCLAVIIDVDALDRSSLARGDRVMTLALDALTHARVQVALVSRIAMDRAAELQRGIPRSCCVEASQAVAQLRKQTPSPRMIAVTDDPELLAMLRPDDRGIALTRPSHRANIVATGEVSVRAVLWWLVDRRSKGGNTARP